MVQKRKKKEEKKEKFTLNFDLQSLFMYTLLEQSSDEETTS